MKIGIYGGSFNPVHYGHIGLAQWVLAHTDLEEVWLMVSPNNPLKKGDTLAPEAARLAAVREAVQDLPGIEASDFEFALPRPSYTANTLRALQHAYPQHVFSLIIGEDNLAIFDHWREYAYIAENYRIFVYPRRSNSPQDGLTGKAGLTTQWSNSVAVKELVFLKDAPLFDISSTEIRNKTKQQWEE